MEGRGNCIRGDLMGEEIVLAGTEFGANLYGLAAKKQLR